MLIFLESSNYEQTDTSKANNDEVTACDQPTQIEDILDLTKEPSKEDVLEEERKHLPNRSENKTRV